MKEEEKDDVVIVSEVCMCGHSQSDHGSQVQSHDDKKWKVPQHGQCRNIICECEQYTFQKFITRKV